MGCSSTTCASSASRTWAIRIPWRTTQSRPWPFWSRRSRIPLKIPTSFVLIIPCRGTRRATKIMAIYWWSRRPDSAQPYPPENVASRPPSSSLKALFTGESSSKHPLGKLARSRKKKKIKMKTTIRKKSSSRFRYFIIIALWHTLFKQKTRIRTINLNKKSVTDVCGMSEIEF